MAAKILYGKPVADEIKQDLKKKIEDEHLDIKLTIFQVGDNQASNTYVRNKVKACEEVGITSEVVKLEDDDYNHYQLLPKYLEEEKADGVMLQLPLPANWSEKFLTNLIDLEQDADCLTTAALGEFYSSNKPSIAPCTAQGIIDILDYYGIDIAGKRALVIGRSNIVGKPIAHLLTCRNATVTIAHSKTRKDDLLRLFATSQIVVIATGNINTISEEDAYQYHKDYRHDFYKDFNVIQDRVIIDVGINRDENGKLCGDLSEEFKSKYSSAYSPVPGGVGPLTVTNLLLNTYKLKTRS